jgi:hypothetical protein
MREQKTLLFMFGKSQVRNLRVKGEMMVKCVVDYQISELINWFDFVCNRVVTTLVHNSSHFQNAFNRLSPAFSCIQLHFFTSFLFPPCYVSGPELGSRQLISRPQIWRALAHRFLSLNVHRVCGAGFPPRRKVGLERLARIVRSGVGVEEYLDRDNMMVTVVLNKVPQAITL